MNSELWAENREGIRRNISLIKGYEENPLAIHKKLSPVQWVEELPNVPILLVHSEDDKKVNVKHSVQMAEKLRELNRPVKLVTYPDGGHSLENRRDESRALIAEWIASISL